ncbi:MAG TPA: hypothetical protein DD640_03580, partial [Clostridiales bacterium]|nr:hypothetical protein [Clostridiales bacterium]
LREGEGLISRRPFRKPHHTVSRSALIGGGAIPVPGEISLAHQGVLFLDEMTEFQPDILDLLRQPLEDQAVRLVRLRHSITYPADFMLVGAANPCRCGECLEPNAVCRCSDDSIRQHLNRLSGPLLDRIDLTVEMTRLTAEEMQQSVSVQINPVSLSQEMAMQIRDCWGIQQRRCQHHRLAVSGNARISGPALAVILEIPDATTAFAAQAAARFNLSVRSYQKVLRVARTIADLESCHRVGLDHVAEALQYRFRWPEGMERRGA